MRNKFFKFHFKNDNAKKIASYDIDLNNFTEAMEYAYNLAQRDNSDLITITNYKRSK